MALVNFISHPLVTLAAGLALSLILYFRQKHLKRLSYQIIDTVVIASGIQDGESQLEVRYAGTPVPQVTRTVIRVWNSGNQTINGSDIASSDRLRLKLPDGAKVLSTAVEKVSRNPIDFRVEPADGFVELTFDFLDRQDGALFAVMHSGPADGSQIKGTVKGVHQGLTDWSQPRRALTTPARDQSMFASIFGALFTALMASLALLFLLSGIFPEPYNSFLWGDYPKHVQGHYALEGGSMGRILAGGLCLMFFSLMLFVELRSIWSRPPRVLL